MSSTTNNLLEMLAVNFDHEWNDLSILCHSRQVGVFVKEESIIDILQVA
ncbi:hypothetical protein [Neobacillus ginsengisoli]|uniref:Uncharacterized protein n=1 Tax=Neobacillus ginsengisoli TaxID=904295 RepID=A0ABT9XXW6_9BACI|nr:hypothetical protein [Neobacillus ginsengisoli]MDQ0200406.1 hypothetical protein [Neobacillus ginsengisoli]